MVTVKVEVGQENAEYGEVKKILEADCQK